MLDIIIEVTGYDKWKLLLYLVLQGISHVSHGDENGLDFRVKRLEQVYPELSILQLDDTTF